MTHDDAFDPNAVPTRLRYFFGKRLDADALRSEQRYHRDARATHQRDLHSYGVAAGLQLELTPATGDEPASLTVAAGLAVDLFGRPLVHPHSSCVDLDVWWAEHHSALTEATTFYVVIQRHDLGTHPELAPRDPCANETNPSQCGRTAERVTLQILTADEVQPLLDLTEAGGPFDQVPYDLLDPSLSEGTLEEAVQRVLTQGTPPVPYDPNALGSQAPWVLLGGFEVPDAQLPSAAFPTDATLIPPPSIVWSTGALTRALANVAARLSRVDMPTASLELEGSGGDGPNHLTVQIPLPGESGSLVGSADAADAVSVHSIDLDDPSDAQWDDVPLQMVNLSKVTTGGIDLLVLVLELEAAVAFESGHAYRVQMPTTTPVLTSDGEPLAYDITFRCDDEEGTPTPHLTRIQRTA